MGHGSPEEIGRQVVSEHPSFFFPAFAGASDRIATARPATKKSDETFMAIPPMCRDSECQSHSLRYHQTDTNLSRQFNLDTAAPTSQLGQTRRFDYAPVASGLTPSTDILGVGRHVSKVPTGDQVHRGSRVATPQFHNYRSDDLSDGERMLRAQLRPLFARAAVPAMSKTLRYAKTPHR